MSSIRVSGNTSGHYDLTVPDVAGSNTIALDKIVVTDSSGRVGIGTDSPNKELHLLSSSINKPMIKIESTGTNSYPGFQIVNDSRTWEVSTHGGHSDALTFYNGSTHTFALATGGNVGIGTTSPDTKLHTYSSSGNTYAKLESNGNNTRSALLPYAKKSDGSAINGFIGVVGDANKMEVATTTNDPIHFYTNNSPTNSGIFLKADGNVGIGTTSPSATLTVSQSANNIFAVERTGVASGSGQFGINVENNSQATVSYDDGAPLVFGTASNPSTHVGFTERMKISAQGYVTMPSQPYFYTYSTDVNVSYNSGGVLNFDLIYEEQGSNYSTANKRFTAPVTGVYSFTVIVYGNAGTSNHAFAFHVNGATRVRGQVRDGTGDGYAPAAMIIRLTAGDYVDLRAIGVGVTNFYGGSNLIYSQFSGCLIG